MSSASVRIHSAPSESTQRSRKKRCVLASQRLVKHRLKTTISLAREFEVEITSIPKLPLLAEAERFAKKGK